MKKITKVLLFTVFTVILTACGSSSGDISQDTIGSMYESEFKKSAVTDTKTMAEDLSNAGFTDIQLVLTEVSQGYLDGFDREIVGFSEGYKFSPLISSIPFIGYVFKTDNVQYLTEQLEVNANQTWNICTHADETVCTSRDNLVFFMMCSNRD